MEYIYVTAYVILSLLLKDFTLSIVIRRIFILILMYSGLLNIHTGSILLDIIVQYALAISLIFIEGIFFT